MKLGMKFEGGAEMARRLKALPPALSDRIVGDALTTAAEPIRSLAAEFAPRSDDPPHMADNIVVGKVSRKRLDSAGREGEHVIEVGPAKTPDDFFYGFFQEFGTEDHAAQPFLRPAFDQGAQDALDILNDELWWAIRRGLPSSSERFTG